jgi:PAS domain S-box-containing protein
MDFPDDPLTSIFPGDSVMARQMRAHDWSATPLGDPRHWPDGLKIPLRMLLTSRFEMWLGWGDDLCFFYNDAYIPTLGIKHPDSLGKPFHRVWAEVYDDVADQVVRVRGGEATWNQALLLLLERSGYPEETYHSFSYSPLYDTAGKVGGMLCVVSEETERVIGERRLETLRRLGMQLVGAIDRREVRKAVCEVFDADRQDFPFALVALAEKDGADIIACSDDTAALTDHDWGASVLSPAGVHRFALDPGQDWPTGGWDIPPREAISLPIPGTGDQPAFGTLILGLNPHRRRDEDITDFARLIVGQLSGALANISALNAERRRADRIWSHSRDLIVVVDADSVFRAVSPSWTTILGHRPEEVVGRTFMDFIVPEDLAPAMAALEVALTEGDLTGYESRFRTKDGGFRWLSWHTAMEDGLVYAYGRDITEQKANATALAAAEDALRQSHKMEAVGQLTGGIAHDFNNLLTGIIGSLDLMQRKAARGQTADTERYVRAATVSAERAAALTQRLLAFARRQPLDPKLVEPGALVAGMRDLIRQSLSETIRFDLKTGDEAWATRCDPNQLESALLNLVINARDAMPDGGELVIAVGMASIDERSAAPSRPAGDYVTVAVRDTGHGMAPDIIAKVFEPFFTTKPIGAGTGLGLSMIYGFARQSAGFVTIESEVDAGTTVTLHLPRVEGVAVSAPTPAEAEAAAPMRDGGRILVVEDEPLVRAVIVDALEEAGHQVLEAEDGTAGLCVLRQDGPVDLLITDVGLPGINGREFADASRALDPSLPVLFVTGYAHAATGDDDWLAPGMEIVTKPFAVDTLTERVRRILESDFAAAE